MEMLRSLRGDKREFCLTVIKFNLSIISILSITLLHSKEWLTNNPISY